MATTVHGRRAGPRPLWHSSEFGLAGLWNVGGFPIGCLPASLASGCRAMGAFGIRVWADEEKLSEQLFFLFTAFWAATNPYGFVDFV